MTIATRICHDFRTPLGGVIFAGEAIKDSLSATDPAMVGLVDSLLNSAEEISALIRKLGYIAKATAKPLSKEMIAMGPVVSGVLQRLERVILNKQATIIQPPTWPELVAVTDWVEIIWRNLLTNAIQHAGEGPRIELGWRKAGELFQFWIQDNGPGVAERDLPGLFQAFNSLHESAAGRGLGLSTVRRLVELQGGDCGYDRRPDSGGVFYFRLPQRESLIE